MQRVAAAYLKPSNRTVGVFIPTPKPDRAEIPPPPDVAALLKDYKGDAAVAAGEAFDPSPANIESRTTRSTLPAGLKVALLPKKTRGDAVVAAMTLRFGDEKSLMNKSAVADLTADMLMRGTAKHTRQQLKDELDRAQGARGDRRRADAGDGLGRDHRARTCRRCSRSWPRCCASPSFPASEFEQLRQENLAGIEQQRTEPSALGIERVLSGTLNPYPKGDVRYVPTPQESMEDVQERDARAGAARSTPDFYGASVGELADRRRLRCGGVDAAGHRAVRRLEEPASVHARAAGPTRTSTPLQTSIEAPDKANAFFIAGLNLKLRDDDPDYPALVLGNYMLGGGFLNSRLAMRIRQKEGLSYGVGSQFQASALDQSGIVRRLRDLRAAERRQARSGVHARRSRACSRGLHRTGSEGGQVGPGCRDGRSAARRTPALARTLASYLFLDRTLAWDATLESKIAALTPAQIQEAMKRHINASTISTVKAGDFSKPAAAPAGPVH